MSDYTVSEEFANALTHAAGAALGIAALVVMVVASAHQQDAWKMVSSVLFGSAIVVMYTASTMYHSFAWTRAKRFLKTLDHSAIYVLIAGSYTPMCLVTLRGGWGWSLFGVTWGLTFLGWFFKLFFVERFNILSTGIYIGMGWLALIAVHPIVLHLPHRGLLWLFAGGAAYTLGAIFYLWESLPYAHSVWHLFVLLGTLCHFYTIFYYVIL